MRPIAAKMLTVSCWTSGHAPVGGLGRLGLGISTIAGSKLRDLRLGAFFECPDLHDANGDGLADCHDPEAATRFNGGLSAAIEHRLPLGTGRAPVWTNTASLFLSLFPLPYDDADQLFLRAQWRTELSVQLIRALRLKTYGDLFLYQGRDLVGGQTPGVSAILGLELSWSGAWRALLPPSIRP